MLGLQARSTGIYIHMPTVNSMKWCHLQIFPLFIFTPPLFYFLNFFNTFLSLISLFVFVSSNHCQSLLIFSLLHIYHIEFILAQKIFYYISYICLFIYLYLNFILFAITRIFFILNFTIISPLFWHFRSLLVHSPIYHFLHS